MNARRCTLLLVTASSLVLAGCAIKQPPYGADIMPESARAKIPGSGPDRIAAAPWCRTGSAISATRSLTRSLRTLLSGIPISKQPPPEWKHRALLCALPHHRSTRGSR